MILADFRECVYQKGFGFNVEVFVGEKFGVSVRSGGLLNSEYDSFEEFLDDLIKKNPLWFTYYYVVVDPKYSELIKQKLEESYRDAFDWLARSIFNTSSNWQIFEDYKPLGEFAKKSIKEEFDRPFILDFLKNKE